MVNATPRRGKAFWSAAHFVCRMPLCACRSSSHKTRYATFAGTLKARKHLLAPACNEGRGVIEYIQTNKEDHMKRKLVLPLAVLAAALAACGLAACNDTGNTPGLPAGLPPATIRAIHPVGMRGMNTSSLKRLPTEACRSLPTAARRCPKRSSSRANTTGSP